MSDENLAQEVKKALHSEFSDNKVIGKIIAFCVTIITLVATTMLAFIWDLKSEVPLLKKGLQEQQSNYGTLQNSINSVRMDQQSARDNQIRMQSKLESIEEKIDTKRYK